MRTPRSSPTPPRGFTLIEILIVVIILGILATLVIPQFSSASQQARGSTLKECLQYLRTQVTIYKAQHRDVPPGYPGGDVTQTPTGPTFAAQLSQYSDETGAVSPVASGAFPFGKYLSSMPVNPFTSNGAIWVVTNGTAMPAPDASQPFGWIYNPQTLEITANVEGNDAEGVPYSTY